MTEDKEDDKDEMLHDIQVRKNARFTPKYQKQAPADNVKPFTGLSIRNLPLDITNENLDKLREINEIPSDATEFSKEDIKRSHLWTQKELKIVCVRSSYIISITVRNLRGE